MSDQADIIGVGLGAIIGAADKGDFCFGMKVAAEKLVMADAAELLSIIKAMLANGALTGHQGPDLFTGTAVNQAAGGEGRFNRVNIIVSYSGDFNGQACGFAQIAPAIFCGDFGQSLEFGCGEISGPA